MVLQFFIASFLFPANPAMFANAMGSPFVIFSHHTSGDRSIQTKINYLISVLKSER